MENEVRAGGLQIHKVNKWYPGNVHAVINMDMEIEQGEFIVFVGPSGCGKTTLLRMIAGLEGISSGEIIMDGRVVNKVPPKNRDIAMVFQNYALYPNMKVKNNIAFPLKMRHTKKQEAAARVAEVAKKLELDTLLERKPGALSGGQRQRVALARSLVRRPKLFLMDEPLANLDAKLRTEMRREIIALQRELGVTTIYVTHDQIEAMTMGTRIAVMNCGVLQQFGTPQEIYQNPANLFVAGFIGSPNMNIWDTRIVSYNAQQFLTLGEARIPIDISGLPGEQLQEPLKALILPMTAAAAEASKGCRLTEKEDEKVKGLSAASENYGNFFAQNCFPAASGVVLIQSGLAVAGYDVTLSSIASASISVMIISIILTMVQVFLFDRQVKGGKK